MQKEMFGQVWERNNFGGTTLWKIHGVEKLTLSDYLVEKEQSYMLDWQWGEPRFWDAGRQGGHADYFPEEILTLYGPAGSSGRGRIMVTDTWLGGAGFYYKKVTVEEAQTVFYDLITRAVAAFINGESPAAAIGYPGPDWPTTQDPRYSRGWGPAKSSLANPQEFLDRNQQPGGGILELKNPMGD